MQADVLAMTFMRCDIGNEGRVFPTPGDRPVIPCTIRIRRLRELVGKSPAKMATLVGISAPAYYDREAFDADLPVTASLRELAKLAEILGVRSRLIFEDGGETAPAMAPTALSVKISRHVEAKEMSSAELEDLLGWTVIESALNFAAAIWDWNVDCLRCVCSETGVNWLAAQP